MATGLGRALRWCAIVVGTVALAGPACSATDVFTCQTDDQCLDGEHAGLCQMQGYCSFPDGACDSGQRFGEHAGPLAGECVSEGGTETGTSSGGDDVASFTSTTATTNTSPPPTTADGTTSRPPADSGNETSVVMADLGPPTDTGDSSKLGPCDDVCDEFCYIVEKKGLGTCTAKCSSDDDCPPTISFEGIEFETACIPVEEVGVCGVVCSTNDSCPEDGYCHLPPGSPLGLCAWPL